MSEKKIITENVEIEEKTGTEKPNSENDIIEVEQVIVSTELVDLKEPVFKRGWKVRLIFIFLVLPLTIAFAIVFWGFTKGQLPFWLVIILGVLASLAIWLYISLSKKALEKYYLDRDKFIQDAKTIIDNKLKQIKFLTKDKKNLLLQYDNLKKEIDTISERKPFDVIVSPNNSDTFKKIKNLIADIDLVISYDEEYPSRYNKAKSIAEDAGFYISDEIGLDHKLNIEDLSYEDYPIMERFENVIPKVLELKDAGISVDFSKTVFSIPTLKAVVSRADLLFSVLPAIADFNKLAGELELPQIKYPPIDEENVLQYIKFINLRNIKNHMVDLLDTILKLKSLDKNYKFSDDLASRIEELSSEFVKLWNGVAKYYNRSINVDDVEKAYETVESGDKNIANKLKLFDNKIQDIRDFLVKFPTFENYLKKYDIVDIVIDIDTIKNIDKYIELASMLSKYDNYIDITAMPYSEFKKLLQHKALIEKKLSKVDEIITFIKSKDEEMDKLRMLAERIAGTFSHAEASLDTHDIRAIRSNINKDLHTLEGIKSNVKSIYEKVCSTFEYSDRGIAMLKNDIRKSGILNVMDEEWAQGLFKAISSKQNWSIKDYIDKALKVIDSTISDLNRYIAITDDLEKFATDVKALNKLNLETKIDDLYNHYLDTKTNIESYYKSSATSAEALLRYLDELERDYVRNNFKNRYDALQAHLNKFGGIGGVLSLIEKTENMESKFEALKRNYLN